MSSAARHRSAAAGLLAAASSLTFASAAGAQDLTIDPRPSIDVSVAPPPAPVQRTYQIHEGLYVRAALGLGLLGADLSNDALPGAGDLSTGGLELQADLLVGGGPSPGLTIGGGVQYATQLTGDWELEDSDLEIASGDLSTFVIGPFIDGYPTPNDGWHFGGLAGLAIASFDAGDDGETALGFGGSAWLGHDVWVAPEWSIGGMLKAGALRASKDDIDVTKLSLSLLFTVVVN